MLLYVAAAAARAVAVNRTIDILDLAIGIGPGDELKYIYVNGIIHEKELQFFCLETVELTVAPFRVSLFFPLLIFWFLVSVSPLRSTFPPSHAININLLR